MEIYTIDHYGHWETLYKQFPLTSESKYTPCNPFGTNCSFYQTNPTFQSGYIVRSGFTTNDINRPMTDMLWEAYRINHNNIPWDYKELPNTTLEISGNKCRLVTWKPIPRSLWSKN